MTKEAMKQALEALKDSAGHLHPAYKQNKAIKALEEALAKQEQGEPVAWFDPSDGATIKAAVFKDSEPPKGWRPLGFVDNTTQQRTWVGLTYEEKAYLTQESHKNGLAPIEFLEAVETKLKEKNT